MMNSVYSDASPQANRACAATIPTIWAIIYSASARPRVSFVVELLSHDSETM